MLSFDIEQPSEETIWVNVSQQKNVAQILVSKIREDSLLLLKSAFY